MIAQRIVVSDKEPPQAIGRCSLELFPIVGMSCQQIDVGKLELVHQAPFVGTSHFPPTDQAMIWSTTSPSTSVKRKSLPPKRYVNRV